MPLTHSLPSTDGFVKRIILGFLIVAATACSLSETATLRVEGTVTAEATGQPVAGATIEMVDVAQAFVGGSAAMASTTTNAQGRYSLTYSPDRDCFGFVLGVSLSASSSGLTTLSKGIEACEEDVQTVDFVLVASTP